MKYTFLILVLNVSLLVHSQESTREFGKISQVEIELSSYAKDKDADAVILFDVGESRFIDSDKGYDIKFTRHKRIKIFNKTAFDYAEISIPYYVDGYGKTEVVRLIEATTYNFENGSLVKQNLDPSTVYEEIINQRWRNKKFVFPNVQVGSILEFQYVLVTPFHFNLPDWTFQDKIPTIYSEYEVRMIPFYEYVYLAQGISRFDDQKSVIAKEKRKWGSVVKSYGQNIGSGVEFQDYVHTYILKDVPAFKDESYISSIDDYIIKMDFQLAKFYSPSGGTTEIISTWPKLNEALLKNESFGKYQKSCDRFAKKILEHELDLSGLSVEEKSKKIIDYVKENFNWNGYYSKYSSQAAKEFIANKSGNSAEINLFLIALLNAAEIESYPVILSTRDHGKIKTDYPFDHFTNYVITMVNTSTPFLSDATENLLPFNKIPTRCLNGKGLIVSKDEQDKWVKLENNIPSLKRYLISIEIDPESLNALVNVSIQSTKYDAYYYRSRFKNDTSSLKEFFSEKFSEINRLETLSYDKVSNPYSIVFEGMFETEKLGENIVINPFLNLEKTKNKLTQKIRSYPVDFIYPSNVLFEISLLIPDGFKLTSLPESCNTDNELVEIKLSYTDTDSLLKIEGNYNLKKPIYNPSEYSKIKYYFNTIIKKFNEQIVLEKI